MATHSTHCFPENPMNRGAWWATVHSVTKSRQDCRDLAHTHYSIIWKYQSFFIRIYQTIFQSGCAILHYRRQRIKVPVASHSSQQFIVSFLDFNHPKKYVLCLIVVLVWISLMTNDVCKDWMFVSPENSNKKKIHSLGTEINSFGRKNAFKIAKFYTHCF